ncbi:hypothetical protein RB653_006749 [Dictyostelium firmibasis]|uniref:Endonuclease/exonuclease/phosphatase domain-containing protein n=1 Tax=Dictyostelium firmibasis TaxID=79012 RepID=A0AAN7YQE7_9MYCE
MQSSFPFSPHKDTYNNKKEFNFTVDEATEMLKNKLTISNKYLKAQHNVNAIIHLVQWNSKGSTTAGYSTFRNLLTKVITNDINFDLFITQEPISVVEKNLIDKNFNSDYNVIYPVDKRARKEVAIVYRNEVISILKNLNPYKLIDESEPFVNYRNKYFINQAKKRIQITHFNYNDKEDKKNYEICVFNFHSVYSACTNEVKKNFIIDFFKFVKWYIDNKIEKDNFNLLIAGDFNYDIYQDDDLCKSVNEICGLKILIPAPPTIDSTYNELEIAPTNIDFFVTISDPKNGININRVSKLPIRFENYQKEFENVKEIKNLKNLIPSKVSTHDAQSCYLTLKKN